MSCFELIGFDAYRWSRGAVVFVRSAVFFALEPHRSYYSEEIKPSLEFQGDRPRPRKMFTRAAAELAMFSP